MRELLSRQTDDGSKWKIEFEDLNSKKVIEIHNALKLLNSNIGKANTDSKDRYDMITNELRVLENASNT